MRVGLDAVALDLFLERVEIVVLAELERDARASSLRAFAQHDRVVIDGVGEKDRVLLLGRDRHAEDVAVIIGLLLDVGHVVAGVGDLFDADHAGLSLCFFFTPYFFSRGMAPMTSTILATSSPPKPIAMKRS